ncbi:MAG: extracellular solute-binding protein [Candidatus Hydrogenedentes bacterium]|nr:extracellular solute-binding protein [Candidatus Hydrogenedentota bacterium]
MMVAGCGGTGVDGGQVVVYTSVDRIFSEPVLQLAEQELGTRVVGVYDTEETKSTGLVNRIIAKKENPDGDIFWSGDPGRAALLKSKNLTAQYESPAASTIPASFRDGESHWVGFSARARVLLVNTNLVSNENDPASIWDLAKPEWKDRVAIANPLFGTTSYHMGALFEALGEDRAREWLAAMKANGVRVVSSNGEVKRQVSSGQAAVGLTDTDDAAEAIKDGQPVRAVFLDQQSGDGEPLGTLVMPNTLSLIRGGPNPDAAKKVFDFLLSTRVQEALAASCAQAPLSAGVKATPGVITLDGVAPMRVDYAAVAARLDAIMPELKAWADSP